MSIRAYSALRAKTAAMRAGHLSRAQYEELKSKASVSDAVAYLKYNTVYGTLLKHVSERTVHRGDLERLLDRYLQAEVQKLYSFCNDSQKKVLSYTYVRYEINLLKRILRALYTGGKAEIAYEAEGFFAKKLSIDVAACAQADSARALIGALSGTPYEAVLAPPLGAGADLFVTESALDAYYFRYAWRTALRTLKGKDKQIVEEAFGSEIDMTNLCWIYRQKRYYNMPGELIFTTIIPVHYKIPRDKLIELVNTPDTESFVALARTTRYAPLFDGLDERFIEQNYNRMIERLLEKQMRENPFSIASLIGYLYFLEGELARIVTAVERIRYGVSYEA